MVVLILALASCGPALQPMSTSPASTIVATAAPAASALPPTASPPQPPGLSPTELKYRLLAEYPDFFFCDPDTYPVAHADEMTLAKQAFADLQSNAEEFQAILSHNGLSGATSFTDDQKLLIYREHKKLGAITLEATGDVNHFQLQTADGKQGLLIKGLIDAGGKIEQLPIEDAKLKGSEISFATRHYALVYENNVLQPTDTNKVTHSKFQGQISGDTIKGKVKREYMGNSRTQDWEAKRVKE